MKEPRFLPATVPGRWRSSWPFLTEPRDRRCGLLCLAFLCVMILFIPVSGCSHLNGGFQAASSLSSQGNYQAALILYEQIVSRNPAMADRALFEMGIIYSYPKNDQKDYQKALECFQKLIREYPGSEYRQSSERMIFSINNLSIKDSILATQQAQIKTLKQELACKESQIASLQKKIETLEEKVFSYAIRTGSVDRIVIEKKARLLQLISKGDVIKTYKIALGGNPVGPKEREGDNKTPEGIYCISARNKDSHYHRSLQISYPNERDKKRARELGVSPGGNIMIHGIKKGFSWVGSAQAEVDWTKGCVAVTDEEIEEIDKLVPYGTIVEIRP